ncbi:hypothetical protein JG687_00017633 [Phytophthora cactorum]|uniref:CCHC-type domain-containing protein n=1 Tax=Phytophthora cactorum TaxID=29920 RepID=A0A8T1TSS2_9STRA|nr:hypothetical protein JG687_00017633 [Phytophthora cactorum]
MQTHLNELEGKAEVLSRIQRPIADDEKCLQMLDSLPSSWSNLVTVFQNQEGMSWQSLQSKLLFEYDNRKITRDTARVAAAHAVETRPEQALTTANFGSNEIGHGNQRRSRFGEQKQNQHYHPYRQRDDKVITCFYCHIEGHMRRVCPMKLRHEEERGKTGTS